MLNSHQITIFQIKDILLKGQLWDMIQIQNGIHSHHLNLHLSALVMAALLNVQTSCALILLVKPYMMDGSRYLLHIKMKEARGFLASQLSRCLCHNLSQQFQHRVVAHPMSNSQRLE